jgi:hypothetical protein
VKRFDSYGGAFADVDGDGDLDLVTNGRPTPKGPREVKLYRNDTAAAPWVAFRLRGPGGDPMPIGAQVVLVTDQGRMVRQVEGAMGSHTQQNEAVLRFGLKGREVEEVWVRWPGGVVWQLDVPALERVHDIAYPKTKIPEVTIDEPEAKEGGGFALRARAKGTATWRWVFDLDGDGNFETTSKNGRAEVTDGDPREVRVRLWRKSRRLGREAVWRLGLDE